MLKLNASYSKKVPVPGQEYSSQSYHCAVECELSDGLSVKEVRDKIQKAFATVRDSVDAELQGTRSVAQMPPVVQEEPPHKPEQHSDDGSGSKATTRQIKFITDLAGRKGLSLDGLNEQVGKLFHANTIYELTRRQASKLVDQLKAA